MAVNFGKDKETLFASADLMSFGKAFSRMAAQPLDKDEVWYDKAALEAYALATDKSSYVGQKVVYIDETNQKVYQYSIEFDGSLKEIGTAPIGDTKSIVVADNGTVSLKGIDSLSFTDEEGNEVNFQPLMTKDGLVWVQPSKTTVEGLASLIDGLTQRVVALETSVGKAAEGENAATGLHKAIADEVARAEAAESTLDGKIATKVESSTYETDKKALQDEDAAIRAIAEGARDTINAFLTSEEVDETVNTLKEIQAEIDKMTDATELETALASKADKTALEALEGIVDGKQDKIADNTYDAYGSAATAEQNAKEYADGKFATKDFVGAIPEGYEETNIVSYINKKAEETLNAANGGSSESAASVAQALETFKTEINPKVNKNTEDIVTINEKLGGVEAGAQVNKIESVAAKTGAKLVVTTTDKAVEIDDSAIVSLISTAQSKADSAYEEAGKLRNRQDKKPSNRKSDKK